MVPSAVVSEQIRIMWAASLVAACTALASAFDASVSSSWAEGSWTRVWAGSPTKMTSTSET